MCASDNVSRLDSRNTFRDMQTEKVQAGATTLLRQQNTVDGVVQGICACQPGAERGKSSPLGCSIWRVANACQFGFIIAAPCVICDSILPEGSTTIKTTKVAELAALHCKSCRRLLQHIGTFWADAANCIRRDAIFHDLIFKNLHQRQPSLHSWSWSGRCFFECFHQHRQRKNNDFCFRELRHSRIKMTTTVCSAWAHTYQSLRLGSRLETC